MKLTVEVRIPDDHPIAVLLNRFDLAPPYSPMEDKVVPNFVGRTVFAILAQEEFKPGGAEIMAFKKQNE